MADPRFFDRAGPFTLAQLVERVNGGGTACSLADGAEADRVVEDVAPLSVADRDTISFLDNRNYVEQFQDSHAGACVVHPDLAPKAPQGMALLLSPEPYRAYALIAQAFYPSARRAAGVHPRACVDETARLGDGVRVEAGAVIGARAEIGDGTVVCANAVVGDGVVTGPGCVIGANASVSHTLMGAKVVIYPGCRIGQDGFGFAMGPKGHLKVPQLGRVLIGDDVEIGANTTIDRGAGPDTVIGPGCRIDNLVQIGHNVELGAGCVIVSQVGISGSTKLGRGVVIGGQGGLAGHLSVGDGVQIAAQSGVMRDIAAGTKVMGSPAKPIKEYWREVAAVGKLVGRKRDR